jgi:hypothetical protein
MLCRKCGVKKAKQNLRMNKPQFLVRCLDCDSPLQTQYGLTVPVHLVPVSVSQSIVDFWKSQGHKLSVEPL